MSDYATVAALGVASGAISLLLTKSTLLDKFHKWLEQRSPFLEEMLSCPWCTSHWVSAFFMLVYRPALLVSGFLPVDWLVTLMFMVAVATLTAGAMYSLLKS